MKTIENGPVKPAPFAPLAPDGADRAEAKALRPAPGLGRRRSGPVVITGGAGFIGANLAAHLAAEGREVVLFDNLSRPGGERNVAWLNEQWPARVRLEIGDVRDRVALRRVARQAGAVFHLAAQVAVTTSLDDPITDFEVNARGTLNVLEELRLLDSPPPFLLTSTNKVYGDIHDLELEESERRWRPRDPGVAAAGFSEDRRLDFRSPYGCSKGAADGYVRDFARTYGLLATVFRMSCIYGPRQLGSEDQGWVAHFVRRALEGRPIKIYGDGKQVRDLLFVDDLVDALLLAEAHVEELAGMAFNIGGGPENAISLVELVDLIEALGAPRPPCVVDAWRPGDQRYYVSDTTRFRALTGWAPKVAVKEGVGRLARWLSEDARREAGLLCEERQAS